MADAFGNPSYGDPNMQMMGMPMGMPMGGQFIKQQGDFDKWRLDTKNIADQLEHQLCGQKWNDVSKKWEQGDFDPPMNKKGAQEISNIIRDLNNRVSFLSELNEDQIKDICLDVNSALVSLMFMNWENFEIRKESARWIITKVMNMVFIGLNRAKGRGEAELLSQMTNINRTIFEGQQARQGFSIGGFFGKKNKNQQGGGY